MTDDKISDHFDKIMDDLEKQGVKYPPVLMTGQEFYDRFEKEWEHFGKPMNIDVSRAAKKAAGIKE